MPGYYYHIKIPQTTRQGGSPRSGKEKDAKGSKKDTKAASGKEQRSRDTLRERSARVPAQENKSWWFPYEKKVHLMVFAAVGVICIVLGLGRGLRLEEGALGAVLFSFGLFVLFMIGVWLLKVYIVAKRERKRKEEEGRSPNPVKAKRTYETLSATRLGQDRKTRAEQSQSLLRPSPSTITTSPESEDLPLPLQSQSLLRPSPSTITTSPESEDLPLPPERTTPVSAPPPAYNEIVQA